MLSRLYSQLLRWAFARFYREFAWTYDAVAALVSRGLWRRWIVAVVPQLQGAAVLELGSGTGYLQRALSEAGIAAVGLDASPQMLRLARRKVRQAGEHARLVQGRAQALPFPSERFSDVVATFPAEYILEPATLNEIWRVLRPGGQVLLVDAATFAQADAYSAAVELAYRATQQVRTTDPRPGLLTAAGFTIQEMWVPVQASRVQILRGVKQPRAAGPDA
jgi:ubiquinone/menaquinone biosynthesis C-methylase UbiE